MARQMDIELILSGICAMLVILSCATKMLTLRRKISLILMDIFTMVILLADRFAYMYRGNMSVTGYWMVRISNFCVFLLTIGVIFVFTLYLIDVFCIEGRKVNFFKYGTITKHSTHIFNFSCVKIFGKINTC